MTSQVTGYRVDADGNYNDWPGRGQEADLDDATAVSMLRSGAAVPVSGSVEDALRDAKVEDVSGIPVSLDSVPGPIDETAPEGVKVPKPNGELREISSTERLKPGDHDRLNPGTVDETSGPVIFPDQGGPSGPDSSANKSSGLKPARAGSANKTGQGNVPVTAKSADTTKK